MKKILKFGYNLMSTFFFDPLLVLKKWKGIPYYIKNYFLYRKLNKKSFKIETLSLMPILLDRFEDAGNAKGHYFFQDLWAANYIYNNGIKKVVDVASRIDGYIAHILPYAKVTYVDIREIKSFHNNFIFTKGSILEMPFDYNSIDVISCLHVIEHIGLGRYGDPIDPDGYVKSATELMRVLKPGGKILLGTPIGKEKLYFDAHRVFNPETIVKIFHPLRLEEFAFLDDKAEELFDHANINDAYNFNYGCGLFVFCKPN
jgi:SAM-dependent methyltransferase